MTTSAELSDLRARIDLALTDYLTRQRERLTTVDASTVGLADAVDQLVLGGGKRLRPAFAYWGYRACGGEDSPELVSTVAALELIQASALIHDDLIDGSDLRRGAPAAHRRFAAEHRARGWRGDPAAFGAAAAILLGDLCLVWSDDMFRSGGLTPAAVERARPIFDQMRAEVTIGQYLDVVAQASADSSVTTAVTVARLKSGKYTVERPLQLGAALADAPASVLAAFAEYGLPLGEAFQLRDDVLGVFGDPQLTGKPAGDDLREGKRTFLVAAAYEAADPHTRARLSARLGDPALDPAGVEELREIIVKTGALDRTEHRISDLTERAVAALDRVELTEAGREALTALATAATARRS